MSRSIFLISDGGGLTELREQPYDTEALLQQLLADHPGVLSGDGPAGAAARRWLLVTREADVPDTEDGGGRWSVDHAFLDQDAVPTLVEVKRSTDSRIRREVVGQMLDYAANAVLHWPVDKLRTTFEARCERQGIDAEAELGALLADGQLSAEGFWQQAKTNLRAGRIRLVFVADAIPPELRRVVEFLNEQMDPAEVLAIEVRQYVANGLRTLVPSVVGQTAEAQQRKASGGDGASGRQWDETSFFDDLLRTSGPDVVRLAREILAWATPRMTRVWWGRGQRAGSFVPILRHNDVDHQLCVVWSTGTLEVYFQVLAGRPAFADEAKRRELLGRLNAIPGVAIPLDALRRRPNVPLQAFVPPTALAMLLETLNWVVDEIRGST